MMIDDLQGEKKRQELRRLVDVLKTKLERSCPLNYVIISTLTTATVYARIVE